jgi:dGTPase
MDVPLYQPAIDEHRAVEASPKKQDARSAYRRDLARLIHSPCFRRLQGKAQLFPSDESDFFRNRLTHSLEVAQIATGIALNLNDSEAELANDPINVDLVHFAALAHDLGHPPFGHDGERALDLLMKGHGGFEGNAQTIRILTRLEKKEIEARDLIVAGGSDIRVGLNLTRRSIASIIKYDNMIPEVRRADQKLGKGYYYTESAIVTDIKSHISPNCPAGKFKTIECDIMDIADDIAYSTYDLEDAFKAGFLSPISMASADNKLKERIAAVVNTKMSEIYPDDICKQEQLTVQGVDRIVLSILEALFQPSEEVARRIAERSVTNEELGYALSAEVFAASTMLREEGFFRSEFTSKLVYAFISDIQFEWRNEVPALSSVRLGVGTFQTIEVLKRFAYESLVLSNRFKMADRRGRDIIGKIFASISEADGERLLPDDIRRVYLADGDLSWRQRAICDFISSMTDRYCIEFYSRLIGINAPSIYKPY